MFDNFENQSSRCVLSHSGLCAITIGNEGRWLHILEVLGSIEKEKKMVATHGTPEPLYSVKESASTSLCPSSFVNSAKVPF